jgi:hypothetical protein
VKFLGIGHELLANDTPYLAWVKLISEIVIHPFQQAIVDKGHTVRSSLCALILQVHVFLTPFAPSDTGIASVDRPDASLLSSG